jgi:hypothetical protein
MEAARRLSHESVLRLQNISLLCRTQNTLVHLPLHFPPYTLFYDVRGRY